jgi:hypothetical protein
MKPQWIWFQTGVQAIRNLCRRYLVRTVTLFVVTAAATASTQSLTTADRDRARTYCREAVDSIEVRTVVHVLDGRLNGF